MHLEITISNAGRPRVVRQAGKRGASEQRRRDQEINAMPEHDSLPSKEREGYAFLLRALWAHHAPVPPWEWRRTK